ncbi:MAG TPA: tetratricopeptide repeat protein [Kofleriaceae bacterium]|nr:tetratricopeptide repeat protein [Kofleriaceae bacterium]
MTRRPTALQALLAAALAVVLLPGSVRAQPADGDDAPQTTDADRAIARKKFTRGKELHAAHKYREAAAAYLEAYDHFPAPAFLYNVAQVYRLAGDREAALENYRKYLELEPDGEGSADAREFVAALEADQGTGDDLSPGGDDGKGAGEGTSAFEPLDPIEHGRGDDRGSRGSPGRGKKIIGTTIGAVGVVALGVAVGFGLRAHSASSELADYTGTWTQDQQQTYDDGKSAERTMAISAAIGGTGLAVGALLFYMGHRDAQRAARVHVGAAGTSDSAFVLVGGAF